MAIAIVALVVFAVAQRGGRGGGPLNAIARAAEVTRRVPGGRAVVKATVSSSESPEGITETGTMVFDDKGRAEGTLEGRGHSTGKEVELRVVADGTKAYVGSDALESIPEGKKWMEIDYSKAVGGAQATSPAEGGPQDGLETLEQVRDAEEVGEEDVEGVPTTHYRGTFSPTEEVFGVKTNFSPPTADVWIDSHGRVRRMQVVVTGSLNQNEPTFRTEEDIVFAEFGPVPKIEVPPQDEVFDATGELESQIRSAGEGG